MTSTDFNVRLRSRQPMFGYWITLDAPVATERISRLGYDFVCLDAQHGLIDRAGIVHGLTAAAAGGSAGLVRVESNDRLAIGKALDSGAHGVIVPLITSAQDAADAVGYARFPTQAAFGSRSYAQARAGLTFGPKPEELNGSSCVVMIETESALDDVENICRVPGLDGVYVGPADLCIALGGAFPGDPSVAADLEAAVTRIAAAARAAGIAAGYHCGSGDVAAQRLADGYTFVSLASDMAHLEAAARGHLEAARG